MGKNWNIIKKDTDSLIEIAYKAKYNSIKCPPKDEVWSSIKNNLSKERKKFVKKRNLTAAAFLLIFIGFFFVSSLTPVGAFTNKIIKSIISITEDTFNIHKKVNSNSIPHITNKEFDDPRIGETQNKINFELSVPKYMTKNYYLDNIDVLNENKEQELVSLRYINSENYAKSGFIQINQEKNPNGATISLNVLREADTQMKEIKIDGIEYVLFLYNNGFSKLMWDIQNISYTINGQISEDEIIKIAKSMK